MTNNLYKPVIEYNDALEEIDDIYNANIEVFVTLENGFTLTITVGTPANLQYQMEKEHENFYSPGLPWIIVQKLTKEIVEEAIMAYYHDLPNAYWLQLCHFALDLDPSLFDELQKQDLEREARWEREVEEEMREKAKAEEERNAVER